MSRRAITTFCAIPTALFLVLIGILHAIVGLSGLRRAIERGEIPARFGDSHLVNWAFSGAAMSMLGLLILLVLPGLRAGSREAARVGGAIGVFVAAFGALGYVCAYSAEVGHRFRLKVATHSGGSWPPPFLGLGGAGTGGVLGLLGRPVKRGERPMGFVGGRPFGDGGRRPSAWKARPVGNRVRFRFSIGGGAFRSATNRALT